MSNCRPEIAKRQDDGTFAAALAAVRRWGGVLEHPVYSTAWETFGLPEPMRWGWTRSFVDDGYTTEVDQLAYEHRASKRTWLYVYGCQLPALRWHTLHRPLVRAHDDGGGGRDQRSRTPPEFRDELVQLARSAYTLFAHA
jgi:hypothetical protein